MKQYTVIILGTSLLLGSCSHIDINYPNQEALVIDYQQDTVDLTLSDTHFINDEPIELRNLNEEFLRLNCQFGIAETKSRDWSWPRFWTITGSDVVGAIVFGLISDWWGALGGGVLSSISSYKYGKLIDHQLGNGPQSPSTGPNSNSFFETTSFVGFDDNGHELSYDWESLGMIEEDEEYICVEDEIRDHLGALHNEVIITLCQQYGDSLATFSNYAIIDMSMELVASWYGLDSSEIPYLDLDEDLFGACILESEEDFESLTEDFPEYSGYFPIVENYIVGISQLETTEQILAYKAQATSLIQNSTLSSSAKSTLISGLDVMICSNGLWILDDEMIEEDAGEDDGGDE